MTPIEQLHSALSTLGLKAVEARLEGLLEQAAKKEPSYAEFLEETLSCEVDARRTRYLRARLQLAHLPFVKTFEQFDFEFQPSIDEKQIRELRSLRFLHETSNVVFLGPPGVGKTHLSVALAEAAIQAGFGAYFITAHDMVADLGRAYREGRLDRRLRVYIAPKVLVIDEMGYLPLDDLGATIFFQFALAIWKLNNEPSERALQNQVLLCGAAAMCAGIVAPKTPTSVGANSQLATADRGIFGALLAACRSAHTPLRFRSTRVSGG
jgi:DNA replication protein DnaC